MTILEQNFYPVKDLVAKSDGDFVEKDDLLMVGFTSKAKPGKAL
jgi:hypothetical protein